MPRKNRISCAALQVAAICALAIPGCAGTMVPSRHFPEPAFAKILDGPVRLGGNPFRTHDSPECASCEDRHRVRDFAHHAMHYIGGPFLRGRGEPEYAAGQATIQPPHSKFHPVPTRPVFEPRESYHPPQPMGVELVPVPEQEWYSIDANEFDVPDAVLLSPPSN